jgi:cytochrome P450
MTAPARPAIDDWANDFDHTHPDYAAAAPEIWNELREECPVAHTERFGGAWLPVRHADVAAIAHDTEHFTSKAVIVSDFRGFIDAPVGYAPPITSDPPFHQEARRLLLPAFSPKAVAALEPYTREFCAGLMNDLLANNPSELDAATDYAQHIPVQVIAHMLGVPPEEGDRFRVFIHRILEAPGQTGPIAEEDTLSFYLWHLIEQRRVDPKDDLISYLLTTEIEGKPLTAEHIVGTCALLLLAGIDTTWSAIGASIWHLANHPADRQRLHDNPELLPFAVEEFLRAYAPVTMARLVSEPVEVGGCPMKVDDWVLLSFPAANRDPEAFDRADEVIIDREQNRHLAFGLGIHRCIGSNLARMELTVALEEWLRRVGEFEVADDTGVRWSTGQVRGPRELPIRILSVSGTDSSQTPMESK